MAEDTPQPGDRVRVTFETTIASGAPNPYVLWVVTPDEGRGPERIICVPTYAVEVLERSLKPGTVKRGPDPEVVVVLTDSKDSLRWVVAFGYGNGGKAEWFTDEEVADWPVIGAVPGTPAAETQTPDVSRPPLHVDNAAIAAGTYGEKAGEPREFPADGPEPPVDVKWLEWTHRSRVVSRFVVRCDGGWAWATKPGDSVSLVSTPVPWPPARHFSFREIPAGEVPQ